MTWAGKNTRAWSNDRIELVLKIGRVCRRDWLLTDADLGLIFPEQDMARGLAVLRDLSRLLTERGILHHVCDGTLLGIVREDGFVPGDNDIDFRVDRKALTADLEIALEAQGFTIFKRSYVEGRTANIGIARDGIAVDFYGAQFAQGTTRFDLVFKRAFLSYREPFDGVKMLRFHGVPLSVPKEPEAHLRFVYGKEWRQVPENWDDLFSHGALFRCSGGYRYLRTAFMRFEAARAELSANARPDPLPSSRLRRELNLLKRVFAA